MKGTLKMIMSYNKLKKFSPKLLQKAIESFIIIIRGEHYNVRDQ